MAFTHRGERYQPGTRVQYRTGYIYVKTREGMESEARFVYQEHHGELVPGDRIFHLDGDRTNNKVSNLAKIYFNDTKFTVLKASRILWKPRR